ncbi:MAG: DUF6017 domain-containing protein [Lachnospiraceae bacterium]|nr:DUF6017 domain-containing protein [Lachnospiraceae bacterium]
MKELEKYGYLTHAQSRKDNKFSGNAYVVYESPELNPNYKPNTENTLAENTLTGNTLTGNTLTGNTPQLNTYSNKESNIIKDLSYPSADMIDETDKAIKVCSLKERDEYRQLIRDNIEYEDISVSERRDVDEIVELMLDVICSTSETVRTNSGGMPHEAVKQRFLELNGNHIDYVLTALKKNSTDVHNIRAYLITALYNAPTTYNSYYTAWVNHDLYG